MSMFSFSEEDLLTSMTSLVHPSCTLLIAVADKPNSSRKFHDEVKVSADLPVLLAELSMVRPQTSSSSSKGQGQLSLDSLKLKISRFSSELSDLPDSETWNLTNPSQTTPPLPGLLTTLLQHECHGDGGVSSAIDHEESQKTPTRISQLSDDDLEHSWTSPLLGHGEVRSAHARAKQARYRKDAQEATLKENIEEILQLMKEKDVRLGEFMTWIFNPKNKQGRVSHHEFFVFENEVSQILDWWMCSRAAKEEITSWAEDYIADVLSKEAKMVTGSTYTYSLRTGNPRAIILDNWLLNPTGKPNSWVEVDLVQEHLNFWIKSFYKAHGSNASWDWLKLISPCVDVLRELARNFHGMLGADQGTRHAEPQLAKDIESLMKYISEHDVYKIRKGRTLDDDEPPAKDVITAGFHSLTMGAKNPLSEYNDAFARLQRRRRMKSVAEMKKNLNVNVEPPLQEQVPTTQETLNRFPADPDSTARVAFTNPTTDMASEDNPFVTDPLTFELAEDEGMEALGEVELILEDLENGQVEELFPVFVEGDVALDMDEVADEEMSDDDSGCGSDDD
ncbi:hypothetical protein D9613_010674 [Agrocybe pediades]|uniref:DUF6589 domain-containing protein n=1 Tax=Agrocybe pediades TaxID=84607 RepID=A0A8H4QFV8_9AGAR|nr:hypothetical protein D9613_010674 [Agrocybe pediades]